MSAWWQMIPREGPYPACGMDMQFGTVRGVSAWPVTGR